MQNNVVEKLGVTKEARGCPRSAMVKAIVCGIVVSEFELHSLSDKYPWEKYEPSFPPIYGLNSTTIVLL